MLSSYRQVLSVPGAWQFSLSGFFGRLPVSMVSLGIVLLVEHHSDSYAVAGTVASAYLLANALFAMVHGRLVDRFGQFVVLTVAQLGYSLGLAGLVIAVTQDASRPVAMALAAVTGACLPQVGSCVRARWSHAVDTRDKLQSAFALESVVDEALFLVGPTVVTVLATTWNPIGGLAVAGLCGLLGTLALAGQRRTQPPAHRRAANAADRPRMPWALLIPLAIVCTTLGMIFGSAEVATLAFAEDRGAPALGGPLLALWSVGSLTAGVISGAITWRSGPENRVRWGILVLALTLVPLTFVESIWVMGVLLMIAGVAIAPTLIATLAITESVVPKARLTEGMALLHTAMGVGVAPGATLSGMVIDARGASAAYLVPVIAGFVGAAAAWVAKRPVASPA